MPYCVLRGFAPAMSALRIRVSGDRVDALEQDPGTGLPVVDLRPVATTGNHANSLVRGTLGAVVLTDASGAVDTPRLAGCPVRGHRSASCSALSIAASTSSYASTRP